MTGASRCPACAQLASCNSLNRQPSSRCCPVSALSEGFDRSFCWFRRRKLLQILAIYLGASWLILEITDVFIDKLALPGSRSLADPGLRVPRGGVGAYAAAMGAAQINLRRRPRR